MTKERIVSLAIAMIWLIAAVAAGPLDEDAASRKGGILPILGALAIALALIWYGDELGDYVGSAGRGNITQRTPGFMVKFFGWVMLLGMIGVWISIFVKAKHLL